jgi:excinuclease UvrABC nuclease subunit
MSGATNLGMMARPAAVYRQYAEDGTLLYIGCSLNPDRRTGQHRSRSKWGRLIHRFDEQWFATEREALAAERDAIAAEHPRFNVRLKKRHGANSKVPN